MSSRLLLLLMLAVLAGCASSPGPLPESWPQAGETLIPDENRAGTAERLWQVFERYEGAPYRYGGTGAGGFDCSGFIMTAYREALGKRLPRTTDALLASGTEIHRQAVRPGDLVFFHIGGKDGHAGIYMGGHQFIHSASSTGVTLSSLRNDYWRERYSRARRFD